MPVKVTAGTPIALCQRSLRISCLRVLSFVCYKPTPPLDGVALGVSFGGCLVTPPHNWFVALLVCEEPSGLAHLSHMRIVLPAVAD